MLSAKIQDGAAGLVFCDKVLESPFAEILPHRHLEMNGLHELEAFYMKRSWRLCWDGAAAFLCDFYCRHLGVSEFENAGMDSSRVLTCCQLVKELFVLVGNAVPIVDSTNPLRSTPPVTLRQFRSEEHTSELQSPDHLVRRLLLEKNTVN